MARRKLLKLEYMITIFVIIGVILIIMPIDIENTMQANFISRWNDKFARLEYMFSVISVHENDEILKSFKRASTAEEREKILIRIIEPYFRIHKTKLPKRYTVRFLNKTKVQRTDKYYFEDLYLSENGMIVGIKDIENPNSAETIFMMMFDINGILPPNTWGKDVYGVNIKKEKIEPFGAQLSMEELKKDCSETGTGLGCSYYYNIGGGFDE